uniref:Uncharacterized protein n=1 Tax=Panagrolaimus sp. ES5 TaxID=591445 RepID=A0AC34GLQ1_9BILA
MSSSTTATSDDETISLVTARSSSPSEIMTPSNSSISGDDITTKTPARKSEHVGAGDNSIGQSFHDISPTSQQGTTSRRRRHVIPRRKEYGTPQAPPKRQLLGGSGMGGFSSYHIANLIFSK